MSDEAKPPNLTVVNVLPFQPEPSLDSRRIARGILEYGLKIVDAQPDGSEIVPIVLLSIDNSVRILNFAGESCITAAGILSIAADAFVRRYRGEDEVVIHDGT